MKAALLPDADAIEAFLDSTVDVHGHGPLRPLAAALDDLAGTPLAEGEPVLLAMPNGTSLLTAFFAVLLHGGVPVPLAPASSSTRITEVARRLGASALITPRADARRYGAPSPLPFGDADLLLLPWSERRRHARGDIILMTSGTSGIASGCLHSFDSLLENALRHADAVGQRESDTVLVNLPLHYSYALVAQALAALVRGSRLVVTGPPFTPGTYAEALRTHRVTLSSLTPAAVARFLEHDPTLPGTLRTLTVGGDRLPPDHVQRLLACRTGLELYLTYGLTEAGPRVTTLAAHREPRHRYASSGLPLDGVRTRLRPSGLGDGSQELLVESSTVLRRRVPDDRTSPLVAPQTIATGDLFTIDEDGYHYMRGRLSDSVVVEGEKVWLPSVRAAAEAIPGVRRSTSRVYAQDGEHRYDLDVYVDHPSPGLAADVKRTLHRLLLRHERPHRLTVRQARSIDWYK
ncbi:class I adenylate-forming enzyme family protein [Streptomyces pilosus]|uniref:class I adenylate-forming enzyme family protein n=1 Tax=Streptomyces pilosus TaxID=28893 RepID=UPI00167BA185|nr:class I adenylate-forming enzyme family protein [Streptomyces pilosus]GGV66972.1 coronafacic acid synthetase [Streptomyces pilosus]